MKSSKASLTLKSMVAKVIADPALLKDVADDIFVDFREVFLSVLQKVRRSGIHVDLDRIRMESIRRGRLLLGPRALQINIYDQCNYQCQFCYTHSSLFTDVKKKELSILWHSAPGYKVIKGLIDDAYLLGTDVVRFCGEGEPFLHKDIQQIIKYAHARGLKVYFLTNLSQAAWIRDVDPSVNMKFFVNLAATSPIKYKMIHGMPEDGFAALLGIIRSVNRRFSVTLSCQVFNQNCDDIKKYIAMASMLNIKEVMFSMPTLYQDELKQLLLTKKQMLKLRSQISSLTVYARSKGVQTNLEDLKGMLLDPGFSKKGDILEHSTNTQQCFNSWLFSNILTNGDVYMCCRQTVKIGKISGARRFKDVFFSKASCQRAVDGKQGVDPSLRKWSKCHLCRDKAQNMDVVRYLEQKDS
jgi:MoaA/NifB/PqqE/SkfB family radical SAM enzyme